MTVESEALPRLDGRRGAALRVLVLGLCPAPRLWLALTILFFFNMAWIALDPRLTLTAGSWFMMVAVACGTPAVLAWQQWRAAMPDRWRDLLFRLLLVVLFTAFLTQQVNLFSHLAMSLGMPFADARLIAWDKAIGFDWNGYAQSVGAQPWSRALLIAAYSLSIGPALLAILGLSIWYNRLDRVDEVAFLALASGLICVGTAALMPSISAWNSLSTPETMALIGPEPQRWLQQVNALRGDGLVSLDLHSLEGIATFPSFHTCLALIILWCSRGTRAGLLAGSLVGLAIIAATPVYGGHYGIDILGGAAVIAGLVFPWRKAQRLARQWAGTEWLPGATPRAALRHLSPSPGLWILLGSLTLLNMVWLGLNPRIGLAPDWLAAWPAAVLLLSPVVLIYREWRDSAFGGPPDKLFTVMLVLVFAFSFLSQMKLFNQLAMSLPLQWADSRLIAWDKAMGFDWNAYAAGVAVRPWLRAVLQFAYSQAIPIGLGGLLGWAILAGDRERIDEIAFLALVSAFVCIVVSVFFPAISAWETVATPETALLLKGRLSPSWLADLEALRGDASVTIDLRKLEGLSTFPSFHTCLGLILIWCSRGPWPLACMGGLSGLAVIASTPVFGGHYGVDLLGGGAVMAGVIGVWFLVARTPGFRRVTP